jgi:hypothetical protein
MYEPPMLATQEIEVDEFELKEVELYTDEFAEEKLLPPQTTTTVSSTLKNGQQQQQPSLMMPSPPSDAPLRQREKAALLTLA